MIKRVSTKGKGTRKFLAGVHKKQAACYDNLQMTTRQLELFIKANDVENAIKATQTYWYEAGKFCAYHDIYDEVSREKHLL